jgi:hypothetical protein
MRTHGVTHDDPDNCFGCRLRTINLKPDRFTPHFNHSVGRYVTSKIAYLDELHRASDRQSSITGIDADYQPVDLPDKRPPDAAA